MLCEYLAVKLKLISKGTRAIEGFEVPTSRGRGRKVVETFFWTRV